MVKAFDDYYNGDPSGFCGIPGERRGLQVNFNDNILLSIPYNKLVEIPFSAFIPSYENHFCGDFKEVMVAIYPMCEMGVYQYGVTNSEIDYDKVITLNAVFASFSVTFPPQPPARRLSMVSNSIKNVSNVDQRSLESSIVESDSKESAIIRRSLKSEKALLQSFQSNMPYWFHAVPEYVLGFSDDSLYLLHLTINIVFMLFILYVFYLVTKMLKREPKIETF